MIIVKINDLINVLPLTNSLEANEFIMVDQNLVVQGEMTEEEVVNIVKQQSENEYDNETNEPEQIVTDTEAIKVWKRHSNMYNKKNLDIDFQVIRSVNKLKREISYKSFQYRVQMRIEDYMLVE